MQAEIAPYPSKSGRRVAAPDVAGILGLREANLATAYRRFSDCDQIR